MAKYSHSQIQLYKQCPLKYKFKYIDWYKAEFEITADTLLGNSVHYALEQLYNDINNFKPATLENVLSYYHNFWNSKIEELQSQWQTLLVKSRDSQIEDYQRRGEIYLSEYFQKHQPFTDIKVIATEANIYFDLGDDITFTGFIDRLDKQWDSFIINDYKTNKNIPPEDKETYIEQLTIYGKWVIEKYWKYFTNLKARLHYLHFDIIDEWEISTELLNDLVEKYKSIIFEIQSKKQKYEEWNTRSFEPKESWLCRFCEYQSECPLFSHSFMDDEFISGLSDQTIKTLIDEFISKNEEKKQLQQSLDNLKEIFTEYIKDKDFKALYGNDWKISISEIENYKITDEEEFTKIMKKLWVYDELLNIDRFKVNKLFKDWKLDINNFQGIVEQTITKTFRSSKKKD